MYEILIGEHLPEQTGPLTTGKTPIHYDRNKAIAYGLFFCDRVCSDGFVMSGKRHNRRKPGQLLSEMDPVADKDENDCTHFISCSLGRPPPYRKADGTKLTGGGLDISPAGFYPGAEVYGILQPSPLVNYLKLSRKVASAHIDSGGALSFDNQKPQFVDNTTAQVNQLKGLIQNRFPGHKGKGDFVAYFADPTKSGRHAGFLVNDKWGITCHTSSRCGSVPITDVSWGLFIYFRFKEYKEQVFADG